jgi:hypothetical protein
VQAQTIESSGKFGRDGKWTDMPPAPEDINDRRALYGSLENDRNKTPKRVNFRMSPRSSGISFFDPLLLFRFTQDVLIRIY